ncbi:hypothetical protein B4110_3192 [Parageobacillus toebii]|uniref:Uncharacterized protein n=1 Tax=Parageobacillus toebii TaxID=153151 RepID=A0A150MG83_9BACL|nr:hypothetical protein B4110_3192 [Parageobacillus toebii]
MHPTFYLKTYKIPRKRFAALLSNFVYLHQKNLFEGKMLSIYNKKSIQ